jgi:hypothetical protein
MNIYVCNVYRSDIMYHYCIHILYICTYIMYVYRDYIYISYMRTYMIYIFYENTYILYFYFIFLTLQKLIFFFTICRQKKSPNSFVMVIVLPCFYWLQSGEEKFDACGMFLWHRHLRKIDLLMACTACLVCLISTVSGCSKKKLKCGASSRHITNLKQSIFSFDINGLWLYVSMHFNLQSH